MTARALQATADQAQIAPELPVKGGHQTQPAKGTAQTANGIQGVEDLKGVLQGVAPATIHRGIDLNVPPGKDQNGGPEALDPLQQHRLDIQQGDSSQIKDLLGQSGELFVQMIGQIHRANRENRIAGEPHEQHPLISWR